MGEAITVSESDLRGVRKNVTRYAMTRPLMLLVFACFALMVVVFAVTMATGRLAGGWMQGLVPLVIAGALPLILQVRVQRAIRAGLPVGMPLHARVEDGTLKSSSPHMSSAIALTQLHPAVVMENAVIVRRIGSKSSGALPRRCFTEDELRTLRSIGK